MLSSQSPRPGLVMTTRAGTPNLALSQELVGANLVGTSGASPPGLTLKCCHWAFSMHTMRWSSQGLRARQT